MTTVGGIRTPATIEVLDLELYGIISCVLAEQSGHYYTVAVLCQIINNNAIFRGWVKGILHTPQMGNRPPKQHHPSRPMKSFEQLKLDVDRANHVFGRAELHLSANYLSTLVFQILIANKANRALLPVTWKFNNNIVVKVTSSEDTLLLAHFNPKSFYTLFSIMIELETSIRVRGDQPPLPPPEAEEMEKSSSTRSQRPINVHGQRAHEWPPHHRRQGRKEHVQQRARVVVRRVVGASEHRGVPPLRHHSIVEGRAEAATSIGRGILVQIEVASLVSVPLPKMEHWAWFNDHW